MSKYDFFRFYLEALLWSESKGLDKRFFNFILQFLKFFFLIYSGEKCFFMSQPTRQTSHKLNV